MGFPERIKSLPPHRARRVPHGRVVQFFGSKIPLRLQESPCTGRPSTRRSVWPSRAVGPLAEPAFFRPRSPKGRPGFFSVKDNLPHRLQHGRGPNSPWRGSAKLHCQILHIQQPQKRHIRPFSEWHGQARDGGRELTQQGVFR